MLLKYKKLHPQVNFCKAHATDVGFDLQAVLHEGGILLRPQARIAVPTGVALQFENGYYGIVCPRSGLAKHYGITVLNTPGVVDSGFTGQIEVILVNTSSVAYAIHHLDKIAQLVVCKQCEASAVSVEALEQTDRSSNGFGSTGR